MMRFIRIVLAGWSIVLYESHKNRWHCRWLRVWRLSALAVKSRQFPPLNFPLLPLRSRPSGMATITLYHLTQ